MRPNPQAAGDHRMDELHDPAYWLVFGLEWLGAGPMAEAAAAIAPGVIPRDQIGYDCGQVLGCADIYAARYGQRVVFFSDLTSLLTSAGHSWAGLGVDWEAALAELSPGTFPALLLTISERAYLLLCDSAVPATGPGGGAAAGSEREVVRQVIARQLAADWPPYVRSLAAAGRHRPV